MSGPLDGLVRSFKVLVEASYRELTDAERLQEPYGWPVQLSFHRDRLRHASGDEALLKKFFEGNQIPFKVWEFDDSLSRDAGAGTRFVNMITLPQFRPGTATFTVDGEAFLNNVLLKENVFLPSGGGEILMKMAATIHQVSGAGSLADPHNNKITLKTEAEARVIEWAYNQFKNDAHSVPRDAKGEVIYVWPERDGATVSIKTSPEAAQFPEGTIAPLEQLQRTIQERVKAMGVAQGNGRG
ncbi:MAG: hypothetical protein IT567_05935 [Alphaproteobacteria bacterium]|nr:hypothetical protein [Alphaproteobacteria bacterium]